MATLPLIVPERAQRLTEAFSGLDLLVLGDAMLDRFIVGPVARISPEAPVPVVTFDHEIHRIGGAANVAHNVVALGGRVTLVGVTGQDETAATLTQACREAGITPSFVEDPARPTTTKVRVVTDRKQQVARIDYELDAEIGGQVEANILSAVDRAMPNTGAVIVSDYLKGCVTKRVVEAVVAAASGHRVPVLVDPKIPNIDYYVGATLVTPNHHEAEIATNMRVRTDDDARASARAFQARASCRAVLMTRGDQGMWLLGTDEEGPLPATAREVADVTGAGDTVIATMGLALAAGATMGEAAGLANEAAGLSVARFGPATISVSELLEAIERASSTG